MYGRSYFSERRLMRVTAAANPKPEAIARNTAVSVSGLLLWSIPRTPKMTKTSELAVPTISRASK